MARTLAVGLGNLDFQVENLTQLTLATGSLDAIVCRYVLEHLGPLAVREALGELMRCLKPGSTLCLVDVDGFLVNLHPQSLLIRESLAKIQESGAVDFNIGRKLPDLLVAAGFEEVAWKIETMEFQGKSLECEAAMIGERFANARGPLADILGGAAAYSEFSFNLQKTLKSAGSVLFYNKFVINARKPVDSRLQRIK
jgi:SAM-dependent methyltransferase